MNESITGEREIERKNGNYVKQINGNCELYFGKTDRIH